MNLQVTEWSRQSFIQQLQVCMNFNGQHFEQLLYILLLAQTTKLFIPVDISDIWLMLHIVIIRIALYNDSFIYVKQKNIGAILKSASDFDMSLANKCFKQIVYDFVSFLTPDKPYPKHFLFSAE